MDADVRARSKKKRNPHSRVIFLFSIVFCLIMSTGFNLFQNATSQLKNLLSTEKTSKACLISSKPSTMDDTNDCLFENKRMKSEDLFKYEADLCEEEKFRTCFLDCSCDCSVGEERIQQREKFVLGKENHPRSCESNE